MNLKSNRSPRSIRAAIRRSLFAAAVIAASLPMTQVQAAQDTDDIELEEVIVTGSILRRTDTETASPVTVITAESLAERGITTVAEALQRVPANNAGTIPQGWNTGFNFASGANAPALRGLTVQATLSMSDGLRMAPYPYADDGHRNFVDLNTIPSAIIDRIEVLRDGASSTYGADAIAGVINVITKKEIQGLHTDVSYGVSEQGDSQEKRVSLTWGAGSLASDGYSLYVSGEYQKQEELWARDRGAPFNTQDWSTQCGPSGSCMHNLNWNGVTAEDGFFNGLISIPGVTLVRPASTTNPATGAGRFEYLNPAAGCRQWPTITITAAQSGTSPLSVCEVNFQGAYVMLQPEVERMGLSTRFTAKMGENSELYAIANWYKTSTYAAFTPLGFNGTPAAPHDTATYPAYNVMQPVYVCATGVGSFNGLNTGCNATNGRLNPYNPYAATGQTAQTFFRSPYGRTSEPTSKTLRFVLGMEGSFLNDWRYKTDFTASNVQLDEDRENYYIPSRIMDVVARGLFNFSDPTATPQEVWDYIGPTISKPSTSKLWQVQGSLAKELMELPGGPLQAAVGASYREEGINSPSGNPEDPYDPYTRYYSQNAVGAVGSRNVKSGFFEINAPVVSQLELSASGRYDDYSSGQTNFSPKFGVKYKPVEDLLLRATWSKGFRIPSFNEAFGLPTTGYITRSVNCTTYAAFCAAHGGNAYATGSYSIGLTSIGNAGLDPEKSTSFTAGVLFEPFKNVSFTVDYWNIEIKDLIKGVTASDSYIADYYGNGGVSTTPGIVLVPGTPDPAFPNATPLLGFIQASFENVETQKTHGLDFGAKAAFPLTDVLTLKSSFDASFLINFKQIDGDGEEQRYAGTLSPCDVTSCSGMPKWRGTWQNSLVFGPATVSLTTNFTQGYSTASVDYGGQVWNCQGNTDDAISTASYVDGTSVNCNQGDAWTFDLTGRYKLNDKVTLYGDILNVLDQGPDFDPSAAYALFGYNPAWQGANIIGRYFRFGFKYDF